MSIPIDPTEVDTHSQLSQFAECVLEPDDLIEVRMLPSGRSEWFLASDLSVKSAELALMNQAGEGIYIGANPRKESGGKCDADVALARCLFADFDDTTIDAVRFRLSETSLPTPTLTIASGHGVHIYFRLQEPITDLAAWTQWQKDLAVLVQSDSSICNPSRLMRIPGFQNWKSPAGPCGIIECDAERVYELAELHESIPQREVVADESNRSSADTSTDGHNVGTYNASHRDVFIRARLYADKWPGVGEGNRNAEAVKHAACLRRDFALSEDDAFPIFESWNNRNNPPLSELELRSCLSNGRKYGNHRIGVLAESRSGPLTEQWLAERMVRRHGKDLRYCTTHGWLVWDCRRWRRDDLLEVERRAKETILSLYRDAANIGNDNVRKALLDFAKSSENNHRMNAVIALARSERGIPIRADDLDGDVWLLNVENGTLDLRTGKLREHQRDDLITKIAPVEYRADAECPVFRQFLRTTFAGDNNMIAFAPRALGSSLSGAMREHALHVWHGTGSNGKSTLLTCVTEMLGDYAKTSPPKLLIRRDTEAHPTELADLHGVRFVASVETAEGGRLDEERVKQLTGGDRIKGRFMRMDFFEFAPTHKIFLATNHKPDVRGQDHAIWRRIFLWPFNVTIPDEKQDHDLTAKLKAEWPGILRVLVEACLQWQRSGLGAPESVKAATAEYKTESDTIGQFLDECCERGDVGLLTEEYAAGGAALYWVYRAWTLDNGGKPLGNKAFSKLLLERPDITRPDKAAYRVYKGLRLRTEWTAKYDNRTERKA